VTLRSCGWNSQSRAKPLFFGQMVFFGQKPAAKNEKRYFLYLLNEKNGIYSFQRDEVPERVFTNNWVGWVGQSNFEWNSIVYIIKTVSARWQHASVGKRTIWSSYRLTVLGRCRNRNIFRTKMTQRSQPPLEIIGLYAYRCSSERPDGHGTTKFRRTATVRWKRAYLIVNPGLYLIIFLLER